MEKYFISIDQGTSGTKVILFDKNGNLINRIDKTHSQFYPQPGWVEHNPQEIFDNTVEIIKAIVEKNNISFDDIYCISISNQRETTLVWDKNSAKPIMNAVVWQCNRAKDICDKLENDGYANLVHDKTGLNLSPYFSAAKANWIVDNVEYENKSDLYFGTMDSYLVYKLTNKKVYATDYSNASRTQLFNIKDLKWDDELIKLFNLEGVNFPEVKYSDEVFGYVDESIFGKEIPIVGVLGDSHAALFGQCCTNKGETKATLGTGSSVMMNIGEKLDKISEKVVTSIGYSYKNQINYVLEGNIICAGATIKWLVDDLRLLSSSKEAGDLAMQVEDTDGVYFIPAFVGLGAPYWNSNVKAEIVNLTRGTKKEHVVRAAEESIAYQINDILEEMQQEAGAPVKALRVDGGPSKDNFLMQFVSDLVDVNVVRTNDEELSGMGVMYMGGLGLGIFKDVDEILAMRKVDKQFSNTKDKNWRDNLIGGWRKEIDFLLKKNC